MVGNSIVADALICVSVDGGAEPTVAHPVMSKKILAHADLDMFMNATT